MKLLLFDIDGTLLVSKGAGRKAMQAAVRKMTNKTDVSIEGVDFSGRTDPQIIKDVFVTNGFEADDWESWIAEALESYVEAFTEAFSPDQFISLPGVHALIEQLHAQPNVQLAILTGNLEKTAYLKLKGIGLESYFPFGAFASDHADRYQLPPIAVQRALDHTGHQYEGKNVVIIGDTKHDILCGRSINVMSIAVSTGHYNAEDLHIHNPDVLLDDLSNTNEFVALVG
ncbi:MAG: HAD family hydrolase [Bacteroidota bacterium]